MGLDNGITVRGISKENIPAFIFKNIDEVNYDNIPEYEFAYWRKEWGLRNEILDVVHPMKEEWRYTVDSEDLPAILRVLRKYLKENYYEENANSIWTYDEAIDGNIQKYINLSWLYEYAKDHPEVEIEFYDSY